MGASGVYNQVLADQFVDAMRKLVDAVDTDLAFEAVKGASRAYGTAGTAPFGTANDLSDFAGMAQILADNGAPVSDRQIVLNSGDWGSDQFGTCRQFGKWVDWPCVTGCYEKF